MVEKQMFFLQERNQTEAFLKMVKKQLKMGERFYFPELGLGHAQECVLELKKQLELESY
jgi:predicted metal-dependent RNase